MLHGHDLQAAIEAAIIATLPNRIGHRHGQVFQFCRWLRAIPALSGATFPKLKPLVRRWHTRACQRVQMDPFDNVWADFVDGWDKVKYAAGSEPIRSIFGRAIANPPQVAAQYKIPQLQALVAFCRELQREAPASGRSSWRQESRATCWEPTLRPPGAG